MKLIGFFCLKQTPTPTITAVICGLALCLVSHEAAQSQAKKVRSHEEITMRAAYARLSFATEVETISNLGRSNGTSSEVDAALDKSVVRFDFKSLHSGNIEEILDVSYGDLISQPAGEFLETGLAGENFAESNTEISEVGAYARWVSSDQTSFPDLTIPVRQVLQMGNIRGVIRYATGTVAATLDGRTHSYKVLWLFKGDGTSPLIIDPNTGSGLRSIQNLSIYPHILLETSRRNVPLVASWIGSHKVTDAACMANQQSECCDLDRLQCGIHPDDLTNSQIHPPARKQKIPTTSLDMETSKPSINVQSNYSVATSSPADMSPGNCAIYNVVFPSTGAQEVGSDDRYHISGNHNLSTDDSGLCNYTNPPDGGNQCITHALSVSILALALRMRLS